MNYSESDIAALRSSVEKRLSEKRFKHTLSVAKTAVKLVEMCEIGLKSEAEVASLLHDIAKEIPICEQLDLLRKHNVIISDEDKMSEGIIHSFTAPIIVKRDFSAFAEGLILSAVLTPSMAALVIPPA